MEKTSKVRNVFGFWNKKPVVFVSSQWTTQPSGKSFYFLLFRWILCAYFVGAITFSIVTTINENLLKFWFIFLSHWGLVINLLSMMFSAILVTLHFYDWMKPKSKSISYRICWFLSNVSTGLALLISIVYWAFMYDDKQDLVQELIVHGGNSVSVLLELLIVRYPLSFRHFVYPMGAFLIYIVFTIIFVLCGGVNELGNPGIYEILDWRQPADAICIVLACVLASIVLHICCCFIQKLRHLLYLAFKPLLKRKNCTTTKNDLL